MKLPKKLKRYKELESEMTTVDLFMFNKINELRDYLSDKEASTTNIAVCGGVVTEKDVKEYLEASKGGCKHQRQYSVGSDDWKCADCGKDCPKHQAHPPQQEESKHAGDIAWCDCDCHTKGSPQPKCDKCYPQEESRGECDRHNYKNIQVIKEGHIVTDRIECIKCGKPQLKEESPKEDEWEERLAQGLHNHIADDVRFSGCFEYVKDYIKANFVSKVRIKRVAKEVMEGRASILMGILLEKLGLEEI